MELGILDKIVFKEIAAGTTGGTYYADINPNPNHIIILKSVYLQGEDIGYLGIYKGNIDASWLPAIKLIAVGGEKGLVGFDNIWSVITNMDLLRIKFEKTTDTNVIYMNIEYISLLLEEYNRLKNIIQEKIMPPRGTVHRLAI